MQAFHCNLIKSGHGSQPDIRTTTLKENGRKVHSETVAKNAIIDLGKGIKAWRGALPGKKNGRSGCRIGFSRFRKRDGSGDGRHASNGRHVRLPMVGRVNTTEAVRFAESLITEETVTRPGKTASGEQGIVSPEERKRETRAWRSFSAFSDERRSAWASGLPRSKSPTRPRRARYTTA